MEELEALIAAARRLAPRDSLRPHTIATIVGLLASTGLRAGEATRLRTADVELDAHPSYVHVRETKFRKSRLVPIHPSTAKMLHRYAAVRQRLGYDGLCEGFFVSERGEPMGYRAVARAFIAMARCLGIRAQSGSGPSLHDLRHTFAVRRLIQWHRSGVDVHARMPDLSVYLGHASPKDTYWYLTATPELMSTAARKFERFAGATS
jgi:integrase